MLPVLTQIQVISKQNPLECLHLDSWMITVHGFEGYLHGQNDLFLLLTQDKMLIFKNNYFHFFICM